MQSIEEQTKAATEMIKKISEEGVAEINGHEYKFTKMNLKNRTAVWAFYSRVRTAISLNDHSFLVMPEFESVQAIIRNSVTFNDSLLSRLGDEHFEEYPHDYLTFTLAALAVISYPFLAGKDTD